MKYVKVKSHPCFSVAKAIVLFALSNQWESALPYMLEPEKYLYGKKAGDVSFISN